MILHGPVQAGLCSQQPCRERGAAGVLSWFLTQPQGACGDRHPSLGCSCCRASPRLRFILKYRHERTQAGDAAEKDSLRLAGRETGQAPASGKASISIGPGFVFTEGKNSPETQQPRQVVGLSILGSSTGVIKARKSSPKGNLQNQISLKPKCGWPLRRQSSFIHTYILFNYSLADLWGNLQQVARRNN